MNGLLLVMMVLAQVAGGDGLDGVIRGRVASAPVVPPLFQMAYLTSGPLIADDANTVAHVTWNGTALVDSKGNTWTQNGTVPQVTGAQASPMFNAGFAAAPRSGAGPYGSATHYSAPASSAMNPPSATPFYVCAVSIPNGTAVSDAALSSCYNASTTVGWGLDQNGATFRAFMSATFMDFGTIVPGGVNVACDGFDGSNVVGMANLGTYTTHAASYTQYTGVSVTIGYDSEGDSSFNGTMVELVYEAATPSSATFTAIEERVLNEIAGTGQVVADTRSTTATYYTDDTRWIAPVNVVRIEEFTDGGGAALVEPAPTTNELLNSEAPATQTTASLGTGAYTGSMLGSGTVVFAAGTAVATGLPCTASTYLGGDANSCHITITNAGTVVATVVGAVTHEQLNTGPSRHSDCISGGSATTCAGETLSVTNPATLNGAPWCLGATIAPYDGVWANAGGSAMGAGASHAGANTAEVAVTTALADLGVVYDSTPALKQASYTLSDSNPHRLRMCQSAGTLTQYVDGALVSSTGSGAGTGVLTSNPGTIYLGAEAGGGAIGQGVYLTNAVICSGANGATCQ